MIEYEAILPAIEAGMEFSVIFAADVCNRVNYVASERWSFVMCL